jgi:hypothetical protein
VRLVEMLGRRSFVVYLLASAAFSSNAYSKLGALGAQRAEHPAMHEDMQFFAPTPVSIEDTDAAVQTIAHDLDTSKESSHVRIEVVHPGHLSCAWNVETSSGSGPSRSGRPIVRGAKSLGRDRMPKKRMPVAERRRDSLFADNDKPAAAAKRR